MVPLDANERRKAAYERAGQIADEDVEICRQIGMHGLRVLEDLAAKKKNAPINVLTHCNAGWLATVDWGDGDRTHLYGA